MTQQPETPLPRLTTEWFEGKGTKEEVRADLLRATAGFAHLARILERRRPSGRLSDYETAAWQYKLAHCQGQLEEIDYLLRLIRPIVRPDND